MLVATLAISGIPGFAGFFSKDDILWETWSREGGAFRYLWYIGFFTALMTSFYMFRLIYLTFFGKPRMSHEVEHHIHESPKSMTVPLIILAICAVGAGWLGVPHSLGGSDRFGKFLEPVFAQETVVLAARRRGGAGGRRREGNRAYQPDGIPADVLVRGRSRIGMVAGQACLWQRRQGLQGADPAVSPRFYHTLFNKWYVDEIYDYLFTGRRKIGPVRLGAMGLGDGLWKFDAEVIDGGVNGAGWITRMSGTISTLWDKWIIDGLCVNGSAC